VLKILFLLSFIMVSLEITFLNAHAHNKWYQSRVSATMNHVLAAANNQNQAIEEEIRKQLEMIKITLAKLKESTEQMTESMERQEILLTNVEEDLKEEEEQEQPQNDEVQELEAPLATDARSDVRPTEIIEVSREKALHIGEFQLVTVLEEDAIGVKTDIKVSEDQLEHNEQFVHKHRKFDLCPFASVSAAPKLMQFFGTSKHRWRWKIISLGDYVLNVEGLIGFNFPVGINSVNGGNRMVKRRNQYQSLSVNISANKIYFPFMRAWLALVDNGLEQKVEGILAVLNQYREKEGITEGCVKDPMGEAAKKTGNA
jgi:hypothetical protein